MAEMDSGHSKNPRAPKNCKFDNCNNNFSKFPSDFLKIVPKNHEILIQIIEVLDYWALKY